MKKNSLIRYFGDWLGNKKGVLINVGLLFVLPCFLMITLIANDFESLAAKNAAERYKLELKKAEEIKANAEKRYKQDLEAALATAMRTGLLEEANRIKAAIDAIGKESTNKEEPVVEEKQVKPLQKLAIKLVDKHNGVVGGFRNNYNDTYTLNLRSIKPKKVLLNITGTYRGSDFSVIEVFVNNESAGKWELENKTRDYDREINVEFDITNIVKDTEIKEYNITFKRVTGYIQANVSEVKAVFK